MLLIIVDAHSKWMDAHVMSSTSSAATIEKLLMSFATHGLPDVLVSDNGPNLVSAEMETFLGKNGVRHVRTAPYHPASNGQAERAVQTLKRSLAKQRSGTLEERVSRFLLTYRVTPHATTGRAPCELLMGRKLQTLLDRVRPDLPARVTLQQALQKERHDVHARDRRIDVGNAVLARDFASDGRWRPATVLASSGAASFTCRFEDGRDAHRHVDQVRKPAAVSPQLDLPAQSTSAAVMPQRGLLPEGELRDTADDEAVPAANVAVPDASQLRRSTRSRAAPDRLNYH